MMNNLNRIVKKIDSLLGALVSLFILLAAGLLLVWIIQRPFEQLNLQIDEVESRVYNQPVKIENPDRQYVLIDGVKSYEAFFNDNGSHQLQRGDSEAINFTIQIYSTQIPYILYVSLFASFSVVIILFIRRRYLA
jgi:ABC-type uncharacterized transport system fused permease/ATPase subunit